MSMMVQTHLEPNTELHQTHFKTLQGLDKGWKVINPIKSVIKKKVINPIKMSALSDVIEIEK